MSIPEQGTIGANRICCDCVGEAYLKKLIETDGLRDLCSYCDEEGLTLSIEETADLVERAFDDHYERTPTDPDGLEYAYSDGWERDGELAKWAILSAADVSEEVAEDIRSVLGDRHEDFESAKMGEECPFADESQYVEKNAGHGGFLALWEAFVCGLKTQSRFFSPSARAILDEIFAGLHDLRTTQGEPVLVSAGPGTTIPDLHRARVFAAEETKLEDALKAPWKHLGTPPADAASAGRMNARGIAVFYGARDAETALSEVRPPVGSKVAMAIFRILRPLKLLNLTALRSVSAGGSIFDPATLLSLQRANFLEVLSQLLSRAVMPHEEASEYLPTQAVADYLANVAKLDGIIFPSIQTGHQSSNVVLFHHAAKVEDVTLPKGSTVLVQLVMWDSDGVIPDYCVWETVPCSDTQNLLESHADHWPPRPLEVASDFRDPTLCIDLESINVRHVRAVTFDASSHQVTRHRFEKPEDPQGTKAPVDENDDIPFF